MNLRYENKKLAQGFTHVIGCDEVGRGCLAGPVVAAAVILPVTAANDKLKVESYKVIKSCGIRDSKQLLPKKRKELSEIIKQNCVAWGIGIVDEKKIDEINIHNASLLAMRRAVENLLVTISSDPTLSGAIGNTESVGESRNLSNNRSLHSSAALVGPLRRSFGEASRDGENEYFLFLDGKFTIPEFHLKQEAVVEGDGKILSVAAASIVAKVFRDELMEQYHLKYPVYNFAQHKGYATFHHRQMISEHGLSTIHRLSFCSHL